MPLLLVGGRVILPDTEKFDLEWTIQTLAKERCTIYMGVPTMLDAIGKSPLFEKGKLIACIIHKWWGTIPTQCGSALHK